MSISRRRALSYGAAAAAAPFAFSLGKHSSISSTTQGIVAQPSFSITPVVIDGKWLHRDPPKDESGPYDHREFDLSVGVRWTGSGNASELRASTVTPVGFPEQEIIDVKIEKTEGCEAQIKQLTDTAGQLQVAAPEIQRGQTIEAKAIYRLKISRSHYGYERDKFPVKQNVTKQIESIGLGNSPGIRSDLNSVRRIAKEITSRHEHPWDLAKKFYDWVWENIKGIPGPYTSVKAAIQKRVGDCEERAGVFIALCRAAGIPARLVWVPNHSWAEFCLFDYQGQPRWIPSHTAAYNWFGWTGAHEVVLQKGDRIRVPGRNKTLRLIDDWYSFRGRRPKLEFTGTLAPRAETGKDPGPGKRKKDKKGAWDLVGDHPADKIIRN